MTLITDWFIVTEPFNGPFKSISTDNIYKSAWCAARTPNSTNSPSMKMQLGSVLALAALSGLAYGAPAQNGRCHPVAKPGPLVGLGDYDDTSVQQLSFGSVKGFKGKVLVASDKPGEAFQFYECEPPSDKYEGSNDYFYYGQVRSKNDPSMCLTPGTVNRPVKGRKDKWEAYPNDGEKAVRMEPCAEEASLTMRKQWFRIPRTGPKGCSRELDQAGWESDKLSLRLEYDGGSPVTFGVTTRDYARILMLDSGKAEHRCINAF